MNKSAREMFEELGYKQDLDYDENHYLNFTTGGVICNEIEFDLHTKEVSVWRWDGSLVTIFAHPLSMQELQAINKMIEELGWNE